MISGLEEGVLAGDLRAVARAITLVETGGREADDLVSDLRPSARRGHLIGVTGAPGSGKSSLISKLAKEYRARDRTVGIIAVDPTSPFSGGAVLGDRIRMQELSADSGVFVRSMGSRGFAGGLAAAVEDAAVVLKAAGKDIILLETVGVGQGELDVAGKVQTTVVVLTPGMGDEIQTIKAGIMEVADVYVVNKADLSGADAVARSLHALADQPGTGWVRPIILTSSVDRSGAGELADACDAHLEFLRNSRDADLAELERVQKSILSLAERKLTGDLGSAVSPKRLKLLATDVRAGAMEPREAAQEVIRLLLAAYNSANRDESETPGEPSQAGLSNGVVRGHVK